MKTKKNLKKLLSLVLCCVLIAALFPAAALAADTISVTTSLNQSAYEVTARWGAVSGADHYEVRLLCWHPEEGYSGMYLQSGSSKTVGSGTTSFSFTADWFAIPNSYAYPGNDDWKVSVEARDASNKLIASGESADFSVNMEMLLTPETTVSSKGVVSWSAIGAANDYWVELYEDTGSGSGTKIVNTNTSGTSMDLSAKMTVGKSYYAIVYARDTTNHYRMSAGGRSTSTVYKGVISGTCGTNVRWELSDGTLTISGTGAMTNYSTGADVPWYSYRNSIRTVVVGSGVTSVGGYAFYEYSYITSVTLPATVTTIGSFAFAYCTGLTSFTLPSGVKTIDGSAFYACRGLTSVTVPASVTSIGGAAFAFCSGLKTIIVASGNTAYCSVNGILYTKDKTTMVSCPGAKSGEVTIPEGVAAIGDFALSGCTGVTAVTIPVSVKSIGKFAFNGCSALADVNYGGSKTQWDKINIGTYNDPLKNAELHCALPTGTCGENLTWVLESDGTLRVSGTGEMTNFSSSTDMPWYEYWNKIQKVVIESGVTSVGTRAFYGFTGLKEVILQEGVAYINGTAFRGCTALTSVTIPASLKSVATYVFYGTGLTDVYYGGTAAQWDKISIGNQNDPLKNAARHYAVPSGTCGESVYWEIKNSTLRIYGTGAMDDFKSEYPEWYYCQSDYSTVVIESGVTTVGGSAFYRCGNITSVTLPSSVTAIGDYAFYGCSGLKEILLPSSVTSIGTSAFICCCDMDAITVASGNTAYCSVDGVLYTKDMATLVCCPAGKSGAFTVPEGVTTVGYSAFTECVGLTSVTIPSGVTEIGQFAFEGCTGLTSVTIPSSVTKIIEYAFNNCENLTDVYYGGTEEQWSKITIADGNSYLTDAELHVQPTRMGDVNGDGAVDLKDVSLLFRWWNGKTTLTETNLAAGDKNGDGVTDLKDAAALYRATA